MLIKDFYKVIKIDTIANLINAQISINKNHNIFNGHFPEKPIVPGVMQQQIVKEILSEYLKKELKTIKISNMKFMALIEPGKIDKINLQINLLENTKEKIRIDAKIYNEQTIFFKIKAQYL